jgi:hypothetical protein
VSTKLSKTVEKDKCPDYALSAKFGGGGIMRDSKHDEHEKFIGAVDVLLRGNIAAALIGNSDEPRRENARLNLETDGFTLKRELAGPNPSALESVLAERIATYYALVTYLDVQYLGLIRHGTSIQNAEFWGNQCERANRNLVRSIAALAQLRKISPAVLQINVAERQVNIAGDSGGREL